MTNAPVQAAAGRRAERKPLGRKSGSAALAVLAAATIVTGLAGRRSAHAALGLLLAGGICVHAWKRRRAL